MGPRKQGDGRMEFLPGRSGSETLHKRCALCGYNISLQSLSEESVSLSESLIR